LEFGQENRIFFDTTLCGLKHAENAIAAGAPPRTPLGSSRRSPDPVIGWGETPLSMPDPTRRLWRVDARVFGASIVVPLDTKSWRRHWSPPLSKVKLRLWWRDQYNSGFNLVYVALPIFI